jgi:hydrogenase maturation protease
MKRSKIAVIGLGNRLLSDDGAGLHAIDLLKEKINSGNARIDGNSNVDLVEAGTSGMNLLHQFDEREKIIFIDAGNCGIKAGEYKRFTPDEVISLKKSSGYSLHEFDLIELLKFAKRLDMTENIDISIYCIQAADIGMSEKLSLDVEKHLPVLVQDVYNEVVGYEAVRNHLR